MKTSFSPTHFYTFFVAAHVILLALQVGLYRHFRSLWGESRGKRLALILLLAIANLPQLSMSGSLLLRHAQSTPFLIRGFASFYLFFTLLFLLYITFLRAAHRALAAVRAFLKHRYLPVAPEAPDVDLSRRAFLKHATAGFGGVAAVVAFGGVAFARGRPEIEHITLYHPALPKAFEGLRIVQLSDFHAGPYMSREQLLRIRELAENFRPDIFVLTGDFADSHPDQVPDFVMALEDLRGPLGTFSVLGNHDYYANHRAVEAGLAAARLNLLRNTHQIIEAGGEQLAIVGVDDRWARRYGKDRGPDFQQATAGIPDSAFRLCLSHQPQLWPECIAHRMHITLSGHTHGGQIGIPYTQISLARLASPYVAGIYRQNEHLLYVNRGLGTVGLPVRLGVPPEITRFTLHRGAISST